MLGLLDIVIIAFQTKCSRLLLPPSSFSLQLLSARTQPQPALLLQWPKLQLLPKASSSPPRTGEATRAATTPACLSAWRTLLVMMQSAQSSSATTPWSTALLLPLARRVTWSVTAPSNALAPASDVPSASRSWSTAAPMTKIPMNVLTMSLTALSRTANVIKPT